MNLGIKLERREGSPSLRLNILTSLLAIFFSFVVITIIILATGANPIDAYRGLYAGSVGSFFNIGETLVRATPLLLTTLTVIFSFKCGVMNIGGEGQMLFGATMATFVGIYVQAPAVLHVFLMVITGIGAGALFALVPAILKAKIGANEIVTTVMFNNIAVLLVSYLVNFPLRDPSLTYPQSFAIAESATFLKIIPGTRVHIGLIMAILAVILVYIVIWRSSFGYKLKSVGLNRRAAYYAGMNVTRVTLIGMVVSAMFAGLAGAEELAAIQFRLKVGITTGYGYLGIPLAYLSGLHPFPAIVACIFFGALENGANSMYREAGVPTAIVQIFEALAFIFLIASLVLVRYKIKRS